jgi:hypothetical protein
MLAPNEEFSPELRAKLLPGATIRNSIRVRRLSSPRLISTHSWFRSSIPSAIYLIRDGRDVLVSYYHYLITRRGKIQSFDDFFKRYFAGYYGQTWHENVESWLTRGRDVLDDRILIIKFEELKEHTYEVVEKVAAFIGIPATRKMINYAIRQSRMDKMREIERSRRGKLIDPNQSFYRGGHSGQWSEMFSEEQILDFFEQCSNALRLAGYAA